MYHHTDRTNDSYYVETRLYDNGAVRCYVLTHEEALRAGLTDVRGREEMPGYDIMVTPFESQSEAEYYAWKTRFMREWVKDDDD